MKSRTELQVYEIDGEEPKDDVTIAVESHWNRRDFVVLVIGGKRRTVCGSDLSKAITNAENVR